MAKTQPVDRDDGIGKVVRWRQDQRRRTEGQERSTGRVRSRPRNPVGRTPTTVASRSPVRTRVPSTLGSAPSCVRQNASARITTGSAPSRCSGAAKPRPSAGRIPTTSTYRSVTKATETVRAPAGVVTRALWTPLPATTSNSSPDAPRIRSSSGYTNPRYTPSSKRLCNVTVRSGSSRGSGRSSTASRNARTAIVAPVPTPSVSTFAAVNPGLRSSDRHP